jgi:hypothetical protein
MTKGGNFDFLRVHQASDGGSAAVGGECAETILPGGSEEAGVSGAGRSAVLGVTTSLVNRYANSEEPGDLNKYL